MNNRNHASMANPLSRMFKRLFSILVKTPEEYPVKYYKRTKQDMKVRHFQLST